MPGENLLVVDDSPTILKVVESALTRAGYQVDTALDVAAGISLARSRRPAVILIDSLIPGDGAGNGTRRDKDAAARDGKTAGAANGSEDQSPGGGMHMCGALAADRALSRTPVVLMTAKGEDLEGRYAQAPNVVDYITKPFSPEAIVAVVTNVIDKANEKGTAKPNRSGPIGQAKSETAPGAAGPATATAPGATAVAQALSQSVGPSPAKGLDRLRKLLAERLQEDNELTDDVLSALLAEAGFAPSDVPGIDAAATAVDLSGQLSSISLSEVITLLGQQAQSGTLRVMTDASRVDLFFNKGRIDLAAAVGVAEEFLLGRFAVEAGHITPDALARVLDERARLPGKPPLFGRDLTERGLITVEQLKTAMRRQTSELAYETLRWARGTFQFRRSEDLPELAEDASLSITVDTLLLEGFRRVDEWRLIERDIPNFDLVFLRAEDRLAELPRGTLTRDEIAVLDALSGKSSVRDVVRSLRMGSFDVSKILYRLLRTKLIRRRVQPVAAL